MAGGYVGISRESKVFFNIFCRLSIDWLVFKYALTLITNWIILIKFCKSDNVRSSVDITIFEQLLWFCFPELQAYFYIFINC